MATHEQELQVALAAVRRAARVCRSVQSAITPDVLDKKDRSPVTVADFASQAVICRMLGEAFPTDPIIGEEDATQLRAPDQAPFLDRVVEELRKIDLPASGDEVCAWIDRGSAGEFSPRFWTLDPIDGTKGFLRREQYAISLALIVDGRIELAVLGCPNLGSARGALCHAVRGAGSWIGAVEGDGAAQRVRVSAGADASQARFCESVESGHSSHGHSSSVARILGITAEPVRLDSQAKYAVVGRGEAEIYMRLPTRADYQEKIWDHAGGVLFVEEAGGRVSDVDGKPLEFHHGRELVANRGVIATNGPLHDELLAALKQVGV